MKIKSEIDVAFLALPETRQKLVCIHCGDKIRVIGGTINKCQDQFPENDWDFLIKEKKLVKIKRIPNGRTDFGVCIISSDYIVVAGGKNSNNEFVNLKF